MAACLDRRWIFASDPPPKKKARRQNHTSQLDQQGRLCESAGSWQRWQGRTRETHTSPSEGKRDPAKNTRPPATVAGQISRRRATKQGGGDPQDKKRGGCNADMRRKKKVRRGFGGPFQERIRYASEGSHSTMQLFKNGLESGASALTMRNLASPSAVFQTSVRKRTPGRTGEVKRHLKRVIASG